MEVLKDVKRCKNLEESKQLIFTATSQKKFEELLKWVEEIENETN